MNISYLCLQATREGQASYAHVHEIINGLRRRKWEVELFEPRYADQQRTPIFLQKLGAFISTQLRLWRKSGDIEVLYVRAHPLAFPTALWARMKGVRTIQEINGPHEDLFVSFPWAKPIKWIIVPIMRLPLKWADALIVVTPQLKTWAENEVGHKHVEVVPNGANTDIFRPDATVERPLPSTYVIFFGALARWQGIGTLVDAVEQAAWPKEVTLVVVGDGAERSRIENAAKESSKIRYLGRLPYNEMPGVIAASIGGLAPKNDVAGHSETGLFPLKLFETLACGVPVIVTDFPGQADLVRSESCGLVIPHENPTALAEAVALLFSDPARRAEMGQNGRAAIVREHSWDSRAEKTSIILSGIIGS